MKVEFITIYKGVHTESMYLNTPTSVIIIVNFSKSGVDGGISSSVSTVEGFNIVNKEFVKL